MHGLDYLWYCAASNVVEATLLTLTAAAVARWMRRPALTHGLLVLAMLALVTPPLFDLPVLPAAPAPAAVAEVGASLDPAELAAWWASAPAAPDMAPVRDTAPAMTGFDATTLALVAWALGSLAVLGAILLRGRRFSRLLHHARPPSIGLAAEVGRLAAQLGLKHPPDIAVVAARVSPMLWPAVNKLVLVLPEPLLRKLKPDQRATLLLHELAHVRRRDHWVRRLESLVAVLFWWLPTVWWLRGCLRHAEEQCCDAWVVWALPESERAYADALLSTVDFLSGARFALPPQASGAGHVHHLKERLTMIMEATTPRRLSTASRLAVLVLAAAVLPVLPTQAQEKAKKAGDPELRQALERIEELEGFVKKMMAKHDASQEAVPEAAREITVDREEIQKQVKEALENALKATGPRRQRDQTLDSYGKVAEWMKKGYFDAARQSYREAAELMKEGKAEAAQEAYRKALQNLTTVHVDADGIREEVERSLKAGAAGRYDAWMLKNPGEWAKAPEQWKEMAEKWRRGNGAAAQATRDRWFAARPDDGDGDGDSNADGDPDADEGAQHGSRIEQVQDQINALQRQLKKLNGELRKLQRRDA